MAKNITLSADDFLLDRARKKARQENTSLNQLFRNWITKYVNRDEIAVEYISLMQNLEGVKAGQNFSRDEMNER